MSGMTPEEITAGAKAWLGIPSSETTGPDVESLAEYVAPAVASFVDRLPSIRRDPSGRWDHDTRLAAVMLAARLVRRRNSPQGVATFAEQGAVYVSRHDPDVAQLLRVGVYAAPRVG